MLQNATLSDVDQFFQQYDFLLLSLLLLLLLILFLLLLLLLFYYYLLLFFQNGERLFIGAPGSWYWQGKVLFGNKFTLP